MVLESAFDEKVFGDTIANNHRRTLERTLKEYDAVLISVENKVDTTKDKDYYGDSDENNVIKKKDGSLCGHFESMGQKQKYVDDRSRKAVLGVDLSIYS